MIRFNGAQLVNQSYNHLLGVCTDQTPLAGVNMAHTTVNSTSGINGISSNMVSFSKPPNGFCDTNLEFQNIRNYTPINGYIGKSTTMDIFPIIESKRT